uniref:Uncharacterized protein n=1 Tax=Anguilla anguilla TaxID=7936 RepID=A0A0E9RJ71_ANGAN
MHCQPLCIFISFLINWSLLKIFLRAFCSLLIGPFC